MSFTIRLPRTLDATTILSSLILSLVLLALSPVLRTLTEATTSDSIWALAAVLFALNAILADYSAGPVVQVPDGAGAESSDGASAG